MGWKPRIATAEVVPEKGTKPWVAIAEDAAPTAVKLFVSIMNNKRYPIKVRMEAATRLVMIAGATFRGEKFDSQGRPAANLPGQNVTRLESKALREVLRQLPPGSAVVNPENVNPGEKVVVVHDGNHSRKPTGHVMEAVVGKLLEREHDGAIVDMSDRIEEVNAFAGSKPVELLPEPPPPTGPALELLEKIWKGRQNG
jgi:mRNA-degrading endonuclease toxin of MazEF toxin-antitoxin module